MAKFSFEPSRVCSALINFEIDGDIVHNIQFIGGCNGNTQGISKLAEGRNVDEIITLLKGINCAGKGTSCPDQLARALELAKEEL